MKNLCALSSVVIFLAFVNPGNNQAWGCGSASYQTDDGYLFQFEICPIGGDISEDLSSAMTTWCQSEPAAKCYSAFFPMYGDDITVTFKVTPPDNVVNSSSIPDTPDGCACSHALSIALADGAIYTHHSWTADTSSSITTPMTLTYSGQYAYDLQTLPVPGASFEYSLSCGCPNGTTWLPWGDQIPSWDFNIFDLSALTTDIILALEQLGILDDNPYTAFDPPDQSGDGPGNQTCQGLPKYWVNTASLNLVVQDTDFLLKGLGPGISMTRTWNSSCSQFGGFGSTFGNGWNIPYISQIHGLGGATGTASITKASGQTLVYQSSNRTTQPDGSVVAVFTPKSSGHYDKLTGYFSNSASYFIYQEKDTKLSYRYDAWKTSTSSASYRLTSITDRNGNPLSLTYTAPVMTAPSKLTDAAGRQTLFQYDSNSRCTSVTTPDGLSTLYAYDANGNLVQTTDLTGTITTYTYDSDGSITSMSVGDKAASFSYVKSGNSKYISLVTDAQGDKRTYSYSAPVTTVTDANGGVTKYQNNSDGTTAYVIDPLQNTVSTLYSNGLATQRTDARGAKTIMAYDADGNLTKYTDALGNITQYTYDQNDNLLTKTDQLGDVWTYTYDGNGNLLSKTSPGGHKTTMTYDGNGQMANLTDPNNNTTTFTHDAFGNLTKMTKATSIITTYGYDAFGINKISETDPNGNTSHFQYDNNRRLTRVTHADGTHQDISYDACAATGMTDENGNTTTYAHDKLLNVTAITDALEGTTTMSYDGNGNRISVINPLGHTDVMSYDGDNRLTESTNPLGANVLYTFDANGNPTGITDEDSSTTSNQYDADNRLKETVGAASVYPVIFAWDALGRLKYKWIAQNSGQIAMAYDSDGRITSKSYGNPVTSSFSYSYDNAGNLTSFTGSAGATSYALTPLNKVSGITYPDGLKAAFTYDPAGNIASTSYPGGLTVDYTYSNRNAIQSIQWGTNTISYARDAVGNILTETRNNATDTLYAYDHNNRVTSIDHRKNGATFAKFIYQRDAAGNTIGETRTQPFDETETTSALSNTYQANQMDSTSGDASNWYTYDADGNMTGITGTRIMSFAYDLENRLTQIMAGTSTTSLAYDATGNRVQATNGTQTHNYHYDTSGRLLFESDATGHVTAYYIYAGNKVAAMIYGGVSYYYHFDQTGNTIALTDSGGNVSNSYEYEPYGAFTASSEKVSNPFTFVGAYGVMNEGNGILLYEEPSLRFHDGTLHAKRPDRIFRRPGEPLYLCEKQSCGEE